MSQAESGEEIPNCDILARCLKVNIFQIDSYCTKPTYSYDKTYSIFRQKNAKLASIVRIFGSTDDGIKVCLHMHQYFPHLSIRQADLAAMYGVQPNENGDITMDNEVVNIFVHDLEKEIRNRLARRDLGDIEVQPDKEELEEDDHFIYQVEPYSSTSIYGFHSKEEVFYRVFFYTTWAMDMAKGCLQRGSFNDCSILPYDCLEFILQFYIDNQIYLNILFVKNVTLRKSGHFEKATSQPDTPFTLMEKEKLKALKLPLVFNEIPPSSLCFLECDITVGDIVHPEHIRNFPPNTAHVPSLPGIIKLWNDQYIRCQRNKVNYASFIDILSNKFSRHTYTSLQNKMDHRILKLFLKNATFFTSQSVYSSANQLTEKVENTVIENDEIVGVNEMNLTLEELNLHNDPSSNEFARTLYCLEEDAPIWEQGNVDDVIIPQLDGMDDIPEMARNEDGANSQAPEKPQYIYCNFQNKKIRLNQNKLDRQSVDLPKLSLAHLVKHKVTVNGEIIHKSHCQLEDPRLNWSLNDSRTSLPKASPLNTSLLSHSFSEQVKNLKGTALQSTPQVSSSQSSSCRKGSRRMSASRRLSVNSCRLTLDSIFEQEALQTGDSQKERLQFVLSQSSQISQPLNDISSIISFDSTEHSCDSLPLASVPTHQWNRCLEMTLMSLELHIKSRDNLTADPRRDPIHVATFAIYHEPLNDTEDCVSDESNSTSSEKPSLNLAYIGIIAVRSNRRAQREEMTFGHNMTAQLHFVDSETDLLLKLSSYVKMFDPDVFLGYVVDTLSWGYLIQRSLILDVDPQPLSRISNPFQAKGNFGGGVNTPPQLVGRIVLNIWEIMRHELTLRSYTFEHVYRHLLGEQVPTYSRLHLSTLWDRGRNSRFGDLGERVLFEYFLTRVTGNILMMAQVNLVRRTFGLASLFGMRFEDVLNRGSQFRVESILFPLVRLEKFVPIRYHKEKVHEMAAPEFIQLVLEPDSALHLEPVAVLDFQSLYPSVMIAYNYCYSTCLGKLKNIVRSKEIVGCHRLQTERQLLATLLDDIHISPSGACFVKSTIRKGLLPKMLEDLLYTRILVKSEMKQVSAQLEKESLSASARRQMKSLKRQLDVCQLGLKLIANVTYGYTSAYFSGRMPCVDVAESIVSKGRETLEQTILFIDQWGAQSGTGAKVVYGDTDSVFVSFPGSTLKEAFRLSELLATEITKRNPYPMKIKLEKIYQPCFLLSKKRYCGNAFEAPNQAKPFFDAKGIETVRRDNCKVAPKILKKCIDILFDSGGNLDRVKPYLQWQIKKILNGRHSSLDDFVFAKEFWGLQFYANQSVMPSCIIARQRLLKDPLAEPKRKERVPYVIVAGTSPQDRLADLVRDPSQLLADPSLQLNGTYYIQRAIFPVLIRIFQVLPGFDSTLLFEWYEEVRHFRADKLKLTSMAETAKLREYLPTSLCVLCHRKIAFPDHSQYPLCSVCLQSSQRSIVQIKERVWRAGQSLNQLVRLCTNCTGEGLHRKVAKWPLQRHHCLSLTCPSLSRLYQAAQDYELLTKVDLLVSPRFAPISS